LDGSSPPTLSFFTAIAENNHMPPKKIPKHLNVSDLCLAIALDSDVYVDELRWQLLKN
jgi:hypothetical protein